MTKKNLEKITWNKQGKHAFIILGIVIFITFLISLIISMQFIPNKPTFDENNISPSPYDYFMNIYNCACWNPNCTGANFPPYSGASGPSGVVDSCGYIDVSNLNWLWNTVPKEMRPPVSTNLSWSWPPKKGEVIKMTAFPYPNVGKSKFFIAQFIQGMASLLDNTSDQVTFPGWQVSIYEPLDPNNNSWGEMLKKTLMWPDRNSEDINKRITNLGTLVTNLTKTGFFLEVTHACYAPPDCDYPVCDDGGYWLYGCSGSGVFWNCVGRQNYPLPGYEITPGLMNVGIKASTGTTGCGFILSKCTSNNESSTNTDACSVYNAIDKIKDPIQMNLLCQCLFDSEGTVVGGALVANNKIDAFFKLWNYGLDLIDYNNSRQQVGQLKVLSLKGILVSMQQQLDTLKSKTEPVTAEEYLYALFKDAGGGDSIVGAMSTVIKAYKERRLDSLNLNAWRSMAPGTSKVQWVIYVIFTMILIAILLYSIVYTFYSIVKAFQKKFPWWYALITVLVTVILFFFIYWLLWYVLLNYLIVSFGYITQDMGIKRSGISDLKQFMFNCAGLKGGTGDDRYNSLSGDDAKKAYNSHTNGFAQTQKLDFQLSALASVFNLDSVIMHAQPNKSGSWAVEIIDVRNTPVTADIAKSGSLDDLIFKLGLCGKPLATGNSNDSNNKCKISDKNYPNRMPPLRKGPIVNSTVYFGYQPGTTNDNLCNCDDSLVSFQYKMKNGSLKTCLFCQGTLSQDLC